MLYQSNVDKEYWGKIIDYLEAYLNMSLEDNFDKRISVTIKGGRPYSYSPREMANQMILYFRTCIECGQPFMISGICFQIGITRQGLRKLENSSNDQFVVTIKKGKAIVEIYLESQLHLKPNPAGIIFILKNMGWNDKLVVKKDIDTNLSEKEKLEARQRVVNFSE